jgi:hypothetical protein
VNVYLPKDRVTNNHQGYGFVEFQGEEDADYVRSGCQLATLSKLLALTWAAHGLPCSHAAADIPITGDEDNEYD